MKTRDITVVLPAATAAAAERLAQTQAGSTLEAFIEHQLGQMVAASKDPDQEPDEDIGHGEVEDTIGYL